MRPPSWTSNAFHVAMSSQLGFSMQGHVLFPTQGYRMHIRLCHCVIVLRIPGLSPRVAKKILYRAFSLDLNMDCMLSEQRHWSSPCKFSLQQLANAQTQKNPFWNMVQNKYTWRRKLSAIKDLEKPFSDNIKWKDEQVRGSWKHCPGWKCGFIMSVFLQVSQYPGDCKGLASSLCPWARHVVLPILLDNKMVLTNYPFWLTFPENKCCNLSVFTLFWLCRMYPSVFAKNKLYVRLKPTKR